MIRDEVEMILKERGWRKTLGAPEAVIDWQILNPYNRIMIYPEDLKFVTKEVLEALILETNLSIHGDILHKAEEDYYMKQSRFEVSPEKEVVLETEERKMRDMMKKLIDNTPVEDLSGLLGKIKEFFVEKKSIVEKPVSVKKWEEKKQREEVPATEDVRVSVIELANNEAADIAEKAFLALVEDTKVYRSAVVLNGTTVRTVEFEKETKGTAVVVFNTASNENALGMRILFDGTLNKEVIILRVTRAELKLSVTYKVTGVKAKPKEPPKRYTLEDTNGYELVNEKTGEPVFRKRKRGEGEGGETPFLKKRV